MVTSEGKQIEQAGTEAVKRVRLENLRNGRPFMINSNDLPDRQCYYEYPDGSITLVSLSQNGREFVLIKTLSSIERSKLRQRFGLTEYNA